MNKTWFDLSPPFCERRTARVIVIPAPYEGTVSYGKGAGRGPEAIFQASPQLELYDSLLMSEPFRVGIHGLPPLALRDPPEAAQAEVERAVARELAEDKRPVLVGGEHSLTAAAVKACRSFYPELSVLQLDAHADLRDEFGGTKFSHACVMRRVAELGVDFVQAGVRSLSSEERDWLQGEGRAVISAREILHDPGWIERVLAGLSEAIYLTLDVDVLDPSEMPATGAPEPGGLSYHHLIDLTLAIRKSGKRVAALDLMELAPVAGLHHPDFLCARLLYTMIGAFWA